MSGEAWIGLAAVIGSVATLITAIGAVIVGMRTTRKADQILQKSEEIHKSTNSNLTLVTENLAIANAKIDAMREQTDERTENLQRLLSGLVAEKKPSVSSNDPGESY